MITAGIDFDSVRVSFDENYADDSYLNGMYMCADSSFGDSADLQKIYETHCEMEVGEVRMLELSGTINIVEKLELDEGAYQAEANSDFFLFWDSSTQTLQPYAEYLKTPMFLKYIQDHLDSYSSEIKTYDDIVKKHTISSVEANYEF